MKWKVFLLGAVCAVMFYFATYGHIVEANGRSGSEGGQSGDRSSHSGSAGRSGLSDHDGHDRSDSSRSSSGPTPQQERDRASKEKAERRVTEQRESKERYQEDYRRAAADKVERAQEQKAKDTQQTQSSHTTERAQQAQVEKKAEPAQPAQPVRDSRPAVAVRPESGSGNNSEPRRAQSGNEHPTPSSGGGSEAGQRRHVDNADIRERVQERSNRDSTGNGNGRSAVARTSSTPTESRTQSRPATKKNVAHNATKPEASHLVPSPVQVMTYLRDHRSDGGVTIVTGSENNEVYGVFPSLGKSALGMGQLQKNGDTPSGEYRATVSVPGNPDFNSYGRGQVLRIKPTGGGNDIADQAWSNGRDGILYHAGRERLDIPDLRPTYGCVRLHQEDKDQLVQIVKDSLSSPTGSVPLEIVDGYKGEVMYNILTLGGILDDTQVTKIGDSAKAVTKVEGPDDREVSRQKAENDKLIETLTQGLPLDSESLQYLSLLLQDLESN